MSFRLRIFLLVMLVAVTAIGATAWLTLNLTSREVARALTAQNRHRAEIIAEIQRYGVLHGAWPGVNRLITGLSDRTHLRIQLQTEKGTVLADSDAGATRTSGPVQAVAYEIMPVPVPQIRPVNAEALLPPAVFPKLHLIPKSLFGPDPADVLDGSPQALVLRQAAQYRAATILVRCLAETRGEAPVLPSDRAPYVTGAQLAASPACTSRATGSVLGDTAWFDRYWSYYARCAEARGDGLGLTSNTCLTGAFTEAVRSGGAPDPLRLYLGSRSTVEIGDFGQPAVAGTAGLLVVALAGTFFIARQVSRPVGRLTDASQQVAEGRLDVRVPAGGGRELNRLAASFNAMAEAVQRSEERQRQLVADVAHEMRTPLSNLRGYLEGLAEGVIEPSPALFASLHEETMLQRRILDDLQVLAMAEAGDLTYRRTPTDLADLASNTATAHRAVAAEAGIDLIADAPAPVWVEADQDRIRQVLGNLLTNAIRYTDRDGQVRVTVAAENGEAVLTVRDTGVGIAAGDLPHVFDRFWRADPARQRATGGTGLGLTIAHRIVTDHGGRIEAASLRHMGTVLTVFLPLTRAPVT
ncbi:sensor histidine kinase [Actinoplanes sp. CA-030573]|uniref:sensor histidine kinase n=1 Tax=Actinoplanes sp. CA-030573 TaxID=3239898 RepID=UPI003D932B93